jgi:CDP-4-dehydro-6-deoxyglucose reductase, E1
VSTNNKSKIRSEILQLVSAYYDEDFASNKYIPGETAIPVSGKVIDSKDLQYLVDSCLDGWFTTGRFNEMFEKALGKYINVSKVLTVNSGSSANLIAVSALTDPELGERAIKPGDEVISVAVSFPTTINPWLIHQVIPVFIDIEIPSYNIKIEDIEKAITSKTKAIMVAHTLGNPFDAERVASIAKKYNLWFIEDCCDALGATVNGKHVGTFGDIGTLSFYPAHHITMGEGGAVFTKNSKLATIMESFRDWGRDCWCASGCDNTCGKRFEWQLGELPLGYDHKYIYSRIGYNLKITDMQAALGLSQLNKVDEFIHQRRKNHLKIYNALKKFQNKIILPEATIGTNPSWFGFLITLKDAAGISRNQMIQKLTEAKIGTRLLFAGDLRKQPYFKNVKYKVMGELKNTDLILHNTFWIGVTPMINEEMVDYVINVFDNILN